MEMQRIQIVIIISGVIGIFLLVASALFIDGGHGGKAGYDLCMDLSDAGKKAKLKDETTVEVWDAEPCKSALPNLLGGIFGLIAAIIQIPSAAICFHFQKLRPVPWCGTTIAVFFFSILAFILPLCTWVMTDEEEGVLDSRIIEIKRDYPLTVLERHTLTKGEFFLTMAGMDFSFAILAIAYCYFIVKIKSKATVAVVDEPSNVDVLSTPSKTPSVGGKQANVRKSPVVEPDKDRWYKF